MSGVTFAMKNMYGVVERPQELHGGGCNPGVADLNCIPVIREKVSLTDRRCDVFCLRWRPGFRAGTALVSECAHRGRRSRGDRSDRMAECWKGSAPKRA